MFEVEMIYTVTLETGIITEAGQRAINDLLKAEKLPSLPYDWQYVWLIQHGEIRGTFPKRVSKFYHDRHGLNLTDDQVARIGNAAKAHTQDKAIYRFDFTMHFDWEDGDFGDAGSCYWDDRSGARVMLENNDAYAIRFYNEDQDGIARAWLVEIEIGFIIFNGYGLQTLEIARVFAAFMNLTYKRITLKNNYTGSGVLWINGDWGFLVGKWATIQTVDQYDFKWQEVKEYHCYECGDSLSEDECYGYEGECYCERCYYDIFGDCSNCGRTVYRDDLIYVESEEEDFCESCLHRNFEQCEGCWNWYPRGTLTTIDDVDYCENCKPDEDEIEE